MLRNMIASVRESGERGATAIEYALIAALIAVAAIVAMQTVGTELTNTFTEVSDTLAGDEAATPTPSPTP
ncbi:Flp family type IVb pilin [Zavarzinia compransoris]|uniref:Flp family type IVb pilin n=1 Tax=Zavarzinia marina TaxID=2911065 RepID=UPI001F181AF4|nr:Flp family type IVb pilin [Zavarzinia marina]MCF4167708.1 Flp family type IVb pilin [Zavarzinia marina]